MARMRRVVSNRVQCSDMAMWAVCGSAVACGGYWTMDFSSRVLDPALFQCFEILPEGVVDYQSSSGASVTVCDNAHKWVVSSGTGMIFVTNTQKRSALAFCCAKKGGTYQPVAGKINAKLPRQLESHEEKLFIFRDEKKS